jgi:hypothetical protein
MGSSQIDLTIQLSSEMHYWHDCFIYYPRDRNFYKTKRTMMKKLLMILSIATVFTACNSKPDNTATVDTLAVKQRAVAEEQAKADEAARLKALDDERANLAAERNRLASARRRVNSSGSSSSSNVGATTTAPATGSGTATEEAKKKGWSDAAKGTAIGAAAGAIGGMLIDKNDARGALIGGVVGAGTGYVIGRAKDRKTGRVVKKTPPNQ